MGAEGRAKKGEGGVSFFQLPASCGPIPESELRDAVPTSPHFRSSSCLATPHTNTLFKMSEPKVIRLDHSVLVKPS